MTSHLQQPLGLSKHKSLLSLDGGGVKGISSLLILKDIMEQVKECEKENLARGTYNGSKRESMDDERFPVDYFDMAAGTSTGGLIALMLFRLRMPTSHAIEVYRKLARKVFSPRIWWEAFDMHEWGRFGYYIGNPYLKLGALFFPSRFSDKPLKEAIDDAVMESKNLLDNKEQKADMPLVQDREDKTGRMFMCATLAEEGECLLLRSYTAPQDDPYSISTSERLKHLTISDAARATSAAPTYLPEVNIKGLNCWDGGLLNNNPIDQLWNTRYDLADNQYDTPAIKCVLSIGTSFPTVHEKSSFFRFFNTVSKVISFSTNTEAKHRDFARMIWRENYRKADLDKTAYFRFNTPTNGRKFPLDDWQSMTDLESYTKAYLERSEVKDEIKHCAEKLAK